MNRIQKMALFMAIVISIALLLSTIATATLYYLVGFPIAQAGLGFLGIAGLGGLAPILFKKDKGKVTIDERDQIINKKAALASFAAAYLVVGLTCMLPFFIMGPKASIQVTWLPMIFMAAGITNFYVHSIVILLQYGWKGKENE